MSRKISTEKRRAVRDLARSHDQRAIATIVGISKGAVSAILREPVRARMNARKAPHAPTSPTPTRPTTIAPSVPVPDDARATRAALDAAVHAAEGHREYAAALLARLRHASPDLDGRLARGDGLIDALTSGPAYDVLSVLGTPDAFADLAVHTTDDVDSYGRDEEAGETEAEHTAWLVATRTAAHARAVELLKGALAIVRKRAPEAP